MALTYEKPTEEIGAAAAIYGSGATGGNAGVAPSDGSKTSGVAAGQTITSAFTNWRDGLLDRWSRHQQEVLELQHHSDATLGGKHKAIEVTPTASAQVKCRLNAHASDSNGQIQWGIRDQADSWSVYATVLAFTSPEITGGTKITTPLSITNKVSSNDVYAELRLDPYLSSAIGICRVSNTHASYATKLVMGEGNDTFLLEDTVQSSNVISPAHQVTSSAMNRALQLGPGDASLPPADVDLDFDADDFVTVTAADAAAHVFPVRLGFEYTSGVSALQNLRLESQRAGGSISAQLIEVVAGVPTSRATVTRNTGTGIATDTVSISGVTWTSNRWYIRVTINNGGDGANSIQFCGCSFEYERTYL